MIKQSFELLANFRYYKLVSFGLIVWGISGVISGWYLLWRQTKTPLCPVISQEKLPPALSDQLQSSIITLDLSGAVKHPGLYEVSSSARLAELIDLAGGFNQDVDQLYVAENLNLATELTDGQKIFVPFKKSADLNVSIPVSQVESSSTKLNCISINTASRTELMTLTGVGEVRAEKIIQNRPYSAIDELLSKEILTEKILAPILPMICL